MRYLTSYIKVYQKYDATQYMGVAPDITYSYYTPHGGASSHDFKWAVVTSQCSATCGTGKLKKIQQSSPFIYFMLAQNIE